MEFERKADIKRVNFISDALSRELAPDGNILDIGCGNGIISRAIGRMGFTVTGIDVSEKSIVQARADNDLPNVSFHVVGAGELEAEPGKYDAIICSEVLEHLSSPEDLLSIISQSLKSQGILIVTVPNGRGPRELLVTRPVQSLQKNNGPAWRLLSAIKSRMGYKGITIQSSADDLRHVQFFTIPALRQLAASRGFTITTIAATNFIEQVFPFSLLAKRSKWLQAADCRLADRLPIAFTSGFMTVWKKITAA